MCSSRASSRTCCWAGRRRHRREQAQPLLAGHLGPTLPPPPHLPTVILRGANFPLLPNDLLLQPPPGPPRVPRRRAPHEPHRSDGGGSALPLSAGSPTRGRNLEALLDGQPPFRLVARGRGEEEEIFERNGTMGGEVKRRCRQWRLLSRRRGGEEGDDLGVIVAFATVQGGRKAGDGLAPKPWVGGGPSVGRSRRWWRIHGIGGKQGEDLGEVRWGS